MLSLPEIQQFQRAIDDVGTLSLQALVAAFRAMTGSPESVADDLRELLPELVDGFWPVAADLGAAYYLIARDQARVGGGFVPTPVDSPGTKRLSALIGWAVKPLFAETPDRSAALSHAAGGLQRIVAEGARETVSENVDKDPAEPRYARHASANACAFCALLATRGATYRTAESAGEGRKYHDHCHCVPVAVWPNEKYEPAPYVKDWEKAYVDARRDGGAMKSVLSNMRADLGVH